MNVARTGPILKMRARRSYFDPLAAATMLRLTKKADYGLMALKFLAEHPQVLSAAAESRLRVWRAWAARPPAAPARRKSPPP